MRGDGFEATAQRVDAIEEFAYDVIQSGALGLVPCNALFELDDSTLETFGGLVVHVGLRYTLRHAL